MDFAGDGGFRGRGITEPVKQPVHRGAGLSLGRVDPLPHTAAAPPCRFRGRGLQCAFVFLLSWREVERFSLSYEARLADFSLGKGEGSFPWRKRWAPAGRPSLASPIPPPSPFSDPPLSDPPSRFPLYTCLSVPFLCLARSPNLLVCFPVSLSLSHPCLSVCLCVFCAPEPHPSHAPCQVRGSVQTSVGAVHHEGGDPR